MADKDDIDDKYILFLGDSIARHYYDYANDYLKKINIRSITPEKMGIGTMEASKNC